MASRSTDASQVERRLALIVELSDDAIFDTTLDGTVTSWNSAAERMFGYSPSEAIGRSVSMFIPPDRTAELAELLGRTGAGERIERLETVRRRKNGTDVEVALTIVPIEAEDTVVGRTVIVRDLSERKQGEQLLRQLGAIVESTDDAIIGKTLDGVITSWNGAATRMYGYDASEVIGGSVAMLVPPTQVDELPEILDRLRAGERIEHFETVRMRKDGRHLDVSLTISPIELGGVIIGASTIARDVSGRKRAERESSRVEGLLEAIAASAPVGFGFVDRDFRIVRINEALAAVNGGTVDEQIGRTVAEVVPELWPELRGMYETVLATGKPLVGQELVGPSAAVGGALQNWLTSFHAVWVDGEIGGVGIVSFDITERKVVEDELRVAKEYAERLIETSNAIILVLDSDANVKGINKAGEEITGYAREELENRNWDIVVPRDRYPATWAAFAALLSETGIGKHENPILTKSGEERIVIWQNSQVVERGEVRTISFGIDVTESVRAKQEVEESLGLLRVADEERRRLLIRLVHAQEEERLRIAGEIHDDPIQALAVLNMGLELLARGIEDPAVLSKLSEARETVRTASASLRHMIFKLHPMVLDREGLAMACVAELEQIRQEEGIEVSLENGLTNEPPLATSTIAFRIAQEALMNIRKHADALHIDMCLDETAEGIVVRVTDDGRGFEQAAGEPGHLGLVSMRERAEMAGGWFHLNSKPAQGTTVEFFLPLIAA